MYVCFCANAMYEKSGKNDFVNFQKCFSDHNQALVKMLSLVHLLLSLNPQQKLKSNSNSQTCEKASIFPITKKTVKPTSTSQEFIIEKDSFQIKLTRKIQKRSFYLFNSIFFCVFLMHSIFTFFCILDIYQVHITETRIPSNQIYNLILIVYFQFPVHQRILRFSANGNLFYLMPEQCLSLWPDRMISSLPRSKDSSISL